MLLSPGQILNNRYSIVKLIGQGGFGAVYRAWDTKLNGPCALKENFDASPAAQNQFLLEASILFNLRHPNLPRVFDSFSIEGQGQYLVMDYIEGEDLAQIMERTGEPLPEKDVLGWIAQVCDALIYLHSQTPPIIHRDVKPTNIRVTPAGQAMLVDFGIAKVYDPKLRTTMGARAVTPGYSPPEQYGQGATDDRSDVYALGATLYALLTHQEPLESIQRACGRPMPAPCLINPSITPQTEKVILQAMESRPAGRFASVSQFKAALQPGVLSLDGQQKVLPKKAKLAALHKIGMKSASPSSKIPHALWAGGLVILFLILSFGLLVGIYPTIRTALAMQTVQVISDAPTGTPFPVQPVLVVSQPVIRPTISASPTIVPEANPTINPPVFLLEPSTAIPSASPTPTRPPDYSATVKNYTYLRSGPGRKYWSIAFVDKGKSLRVLGKDASERWLVVEYIGHQAWIDLSAVDFPFSLQDLPVISVPPLPTNTPHQPNGVPEDNGIKRSGFTGKG